MEISLLLDLITASKAMNSKRDSVHQEEVHLCLAPAWSCNRTVLLSKKLPVILTSLTSVPTATWHCWGQGCVVKPRVWNSCWGRFHCVRMTLPSSKHILLHRPGKDQILSFGFIWVIPGSLKSCTQWGWRQIPADINGVSLCHSLYFCCCFLCCSSPFPSLKLLPEGKRKATLLNKLWNIYICEANPLCLAPPLILSWRFL